MQFTTPLALALLLMIPLVCYLGWPRQAYRRRRDALSLLLRSGIILLLVLALAGAQVLRGADRLAVVFLIDSSDSMAPAQREAARDYVRAALVRMNPDDLAGIIQFGADAVIERSLSSLRDLRDFQSTAPAGNSDLEEAIRLALGMFPADVARRIVILSDGQQTLGSAESAAELAAAGGVEISYVPSAAETAPEIQVTEVVVPDTVNPGQTFDLTITIDAEEAAPARITVLESGAILRQDTVDLRQGTNRFALTLQAGSAGFKDFQVRVDPLASDSFYQNNQLAAFSRVVGPPRVLLVRQDETESRFLEAALAQAGLTVDTASPLNLPFTLVGLAPYESVILVNVPATTLTPRRMETLQAYVRDLGGGLLVVGGPQSYGPGGYFQTPLEETLPVESQIKDQQRLPQLTIAYVIDRSGSMSAVGPSGVENIELAKEAIIRSLDLLQPTDRAGVVSFDSVGYWIANLQQVRDRFTLQRLVASLRAEGGTDILAGMRLVSEDIAPDPAARKHIILLTDGGADATGLIDLTRALNEEANVTTSVIALGAGAAPFLVRMAEVGGGNYHPVELAEQIPTIFTQETVLATRSYILEEPFVPILSAVSPIMDGITSAPNLLGYVATTPRQTAEIILRGPEPYRDPLLAAWQYGLGRSVAFTSDATARWAANWLNWDEFVRFWGQAVRWTMTEGTVNNVETRVVMEGERARLIVDARDASDGFLNGLDLGLSLVNPNDEAEALQLQQVGPGRYEVTFEPGEEGAYLLALRGTGEQDGEPLIVNQTNGWVMSYSAEYDRTAPRDGPALLADVAALTGGQDLSDTPEAVFAHTLETRASGAPAAPWLILLALLLLPVDIAVRRLIITRSDLQRLRQFFRRTTTDTPVTEHISALRGAKQRGRERAEETAASTASALLGSRGQRQVDKDADTVNAPERPASTPRPASPSPSSTASELLARRRQRADTRETGER